MNLTEDLEQAIAGKDKLKVENLFSSLAPLDAAQAVAQLSKKNQRQLFALLNAKQAAGVVEAMPSVERSTIIRGISQEKASGIMDAMESDECADLLLELPKDKREQLIQGMTPTGAQEVRELISYPENSAGSLMAKEYIAFDKSAKVSEVLKFLRNHSATFDQYSVSYVYVLNQDKQLIGVLRLRDLILKSLDASIEEIMIRNPISISVNAPVDEVKELFEQHHFLALPVVSANQRMAGIITADDVRKTTEKSNIETLLRFTGIGGGEELRTMPLFVRIRNRLSWLSLNIGLNVISASVIALFQDTLQEVIVMAVFLPIISDMSGCSGSQAMAVSIRELTLGRISFKDYRSILGKEIVMGLISGLILGLEIGLIAFLWKKMAILGVVVALALWANTLIAVAFGGILPVFLRKFRWDPAIASSPILTTVTDASGFFIALSLTSLFLPYFSQ